MTINNINQLVNEVYQQLKEKKYHTKNYTLLESVEVYLQDFQKEGGILEKEIEIKEEIFNFFEYEYYGTLTEFPSEL